MLRLVPEQQEFLDNVRTAMESCFDQDRRRILHALQVSAYTAQMLDYIEADPVIALSAAYLHDIGIHEAERKHNSTAGNWQEIEGPPIARALLAELGADDDLIGSVAELVGNHHTPKGVDSPEFRILWDADALVNFAEILPKKALAERESILCQHMATEPGYQIAKRMFLEEQGGR